MNNFITILKKNKVLLRIYKKKHSILKPFRDNINIRKTLIINFKQFPLSIAIKFPIIIYNKVKFKSLKGEIIINAPIERGMIKLGLNTDNFSESRGGALIVLYGKIIFNGYMIASVDYLLDVSVNAEIVFGNCTFIGNSVKLRSEKKIEIDDFARIGAESVLFDTNFHYVKNLNTGEIHDKAQKIYIGKFCWIGFRTSILKGAKLPHHTIVGSNSLINKDFYKRIKEFTLIAGVPAIKRNEDIVRLYSNEKKLTNFYLLNTNEIYKSNVEYVDESDKIIEAFRRF